MNPLHHTVITWPLKHVACVYVSGACTHPCAFVFMGLRSLPDTAVMCRGNELVPTPSPSLISLTVPCYLMDRQTQQTSPTYNKQLTQHATTHTNMSAACQKGNIFTCLSTRGKWIRLRRLLLAITVTHAHIHAVYLQPVCWHLPSSSISLMTPL